MPVHKLERRFFLKLCGTAAVGSSLFLHPLKLPASAISKKKNTRFKLSKPNWIIYENGSYDLISKEIVLKNCRPAIDGQGVMAKNVFLGDSPKGKRIVYELSGGFLMLDLKTHKDSISIGAELSGFSRAPRWFYPISQAEIYGVEEFYKQGFGTGGPSGIYPVVRSSVKDWGNISGEQSWSYDSYMAFAFLGKEETIAVGNADHNDFLQRSTIYNKPHRDGLADRRTGDEQLFFESAMLLEKTAIQNEYIKLPELYFYAGNKPFETLQELAWKISEESKASQGAVISYHWITDGRKNEVSSFDDMKKEIDFLAEKNPTIRVHSILINKGYCTYGDWLEPNENWTGGHDRAAREIFKNGYRAGIWLAPFIASKESRLFQQHPDWFVKDYSNNLIPEEINEEGIFYALDLSHPGVLKHLSKIFKILRKTGYIFFETAYLEAGFKDSATYKKTNPGKSSIQTFRNALRVIRQEIGPGSILLANQTPFAPVIGFADIVKTGNPVADHWTLNGTVNSIQESYFDHYMNNVLWQNNPGPVVLSKNETKLTEKERIALALWNGILGGAVETTNELTNLDNNELGLLRFLEPSKRYKNAYFPFWPSTSEIKIAVRSYKQQRSWGILFFNDKDTPMQTSYLVEDLIDENSAFVYSWKPDLPISFGDLPEIQVNLQPHEACLFYLSKNETPPPEHLTLGGQLYDEN